MVDDESVLRELWGGCKHQVHRGDVLWPNPAALHGDHEEHLIDAVLLQRLRDSVGCLLSLFLVAEAGRIQQPQELAALSDFELEPYGNADSQSFLEDDLLRKSVEDHALARARVANHEDVGGQHAVGFHNGSW